MKNKFFHVFQIPFDHAVEQVADQLKAVARGEYRHPTGGSAEKRKFGTIVFAAVTLPVTEVVAAVHKVVNADPSTLALCITLGLYCTVNKWHVFDRWRRKKSGQRAGSWAGTWSV